MAKANPSQLAELLRLRDDVIHIMKDMSEWQEYDVDRLSLIPLGVLRKNSTQRHGVTRWQLGANPDELDIMDVEVIDLHPRLLEERWKPYAAFVLHHEYIHALGFRSHNKIFRYLEAAWPGSSAAKHGPEFTELLRFQNATWIWSCKSCGKGYPRKRQGRGRYKCRACNVVLKDVKVSQ